MQKNSNTFSVLVSGGNGQLGSEINQMSTEADVHVFSRSDMDIQNIDQLIDLFEKHKPKYFINTAAYTKVDDAEDFENICFSVNAEALVELSRLCNKYACCLLHISSDYVYDYDPGRPLMESDEIHAKGIYAKSKFEGEENIRKIANNYAIIRTSWVYSQYGKNFVQTMIRLSEKYDSLKVVNDQIGSPTHAKDIAVMLFDLISHVQNRASQTIQETFNYSNEGVTNWADFAREIFKKIGAETKVINVSTEEYGAKAPRPRWSVMSKTKIKSLLNIDIPNWEDSLDEYLEATGSTVIKL